uniref:hypothetical protein n=1 Tax=Alistipes sp. ZOR0009 TaxID=1339253 RepID=UPI001E539B9C
LDGTTAPLRLQAKPARIDSTEAIASAERRPIAVKLSLFIMFDPNGVEKTLTHPYYKPFIPPE